MTMLDGTYDGGGDGYDDGYAEEEVDHGDEGDEGDAQEFDFPQPEDYSNDANDYESHQLALDNDLDFGADDY